MKSARTGCEFCYVAHVVVFQQMKRPEPIHLPDNNTIKFILELTCLYETHVQSRCPRGVINAKNGFSNAAMRNGEHLAQYPNTPSCYETNDFRHR